MNPRQNKIMYKIWMTESEEKGILDGIKMMNTPWSRSQGMIIISDIMERIYKRGDLIK